MTKETYEDLKGLILDETFVKMVQERALENSLNGEELHVAGELYVSKDENKKEQILSGKKKVGFYLGIIALTGVLAGSIKIMGDMDKAEPVRREVFRTETYQDAIGGNYRTENVHDEEFRDYVTELSDLKLNKLVDETKKEMKADGYVEEAKDVLAVVDTMENNFIEENKEGKAR